MKINIFDKKNKKFGKLSNEFYLPIELHNKTWKTINHYIYSNLVDTPIYQIMIKNSKIPINTYKSIKTDNYKDNISNILDEYIYHKINDGEFNFEEDNTDFTYQKFRKELLKNGNKRIIYRSKNEVLGIGDGNGLNLIGKIYEKYRYKLQIEIKKKNELIEKKKKEQLIYNIYKLLNIIEMLIINNYDIRNLLNLNYKQLNNKIESLKEEYDIGDNYIDISSILSLYNNKLISNYNIIKHSLESINYIIPIYLKFNIKKIKEKEKDIDKIIFINYLNDKIKKHNPSLTIDEHNKIISHHLSKLDDRQLSLLQKKISNYYQQDLIKFFDVDIENSMIDKLNIIKSIIPTDEEISNFQKMSLHKLEISNDILCNIDNFKAGLFNNNISFNEDEIDEIFKNPLSSDSKYSPNFLKNICISGSNNSILTSQFEDTFSKEEIESAINYARNKVDGKDYPKPLIGYVQRYLNRLPPKIEVQDIEESSNNDIEEPDKKKFFANLQLTPQKEVEEMSIKIFDDDNIFNILIKDYFSPMYIEPVYISNLYYPNMTYYIYVSLINILLKKTKYKKIKTIHMAYKYILKNKELDDYPGLLDINLFETIENINITFEKLKQDLTCDIIKKLYIEIIDQKLQIHEVYKQLMNTKNNKLFNYNGNINCLGINDKDEGLNFAGKYLMRYRDQKFNKQVINRIEDVSKFKDLFQDEKLNDWIITKITDVCLIISVFILYLEENVDSILIQKILTELYKPCFDLKNEYDNTIPFNLKMEINNIFQNKLIELYQTQKWNYIEDIENIQLSSESISIIWNYISILIYNIISISKENNIKPIDLIENSQNNLFKYDTDIKKAITNVILTFENIIEKPVEITDIFVYSIYIILIGNNSDITFKDEVNKIIFSKEYLEKYYVNGNVTLLNKLYHNLENYIINKIDIKHLDKIKITNRIHFFSQLQMKKDVIEITEDIDTTELISKIFAGELDDEIENIQEIEDKIEIEKIDNIIQEIEDDDEIDFDEIL